LVEEELKSEASLPHDQHSDGSYKWKVNENKEERLVRLFIHLRELVMCNAGMGA